VFRAIAGTTELEVVAEGELHDARPELQTRFGAACPSFLTEHAVAQFQDWLPVVPGDILGVTVPADPTAGAYFILWRPHLVTLVRRPVGSAKIRRS
jgi:hypothetical protein